MSKIQHSAALELYEAGHTDGAIARAFGCRRSAVAMWRKANHLESKHQQVAASPLRIELEHLGAALKLCAKTTDDARELLLLVGEMLENMEGGTD